MDSRDSSAASNSSVNPSADEEGAHCSAIAKEAALLFQSRRYSECLELLRELSQKKEHDPKVIFPCTPCISAVFVCFIVRLGELL